MSPFATPPGSGDKGELSPCASDARFSGLLPTPEPTAECLPARSHVSYLLRTV